MPNLNAAFIITIYLIKSWNCRRFLWLILHKIIYIFLLYEQFEKSYNIGSDSRNNYKEPK